MRLSKEDIALLRKLEEADAVATLEKASAAEAANPSDTATDNAPDVGLDAASDTAPVTTATPPPGSLAAAADDQVEQPASTLDVPRAMFEYSLVTRLPSGDLQLTKTGARALFQAECINALEMAAAGLAPDMTGGVERWLVSSGFMDAVKRSVTRRGRLWLESLSPETAMADSPCPEAAAQFTARRAAAQDLSG